VIDGGRKPESRIRLIPFDEIKLGTEPRYLVKGIIPREGLVVIWGPPKCGKSFWIFDLAMHVALGWQYRDRRVQRGAVVYCAFEGQIGIQARVEAFRQTFPIETDEPVQFYLEPLTLDLIADHPELIAAIRRQLGLADPALVVLDTLNRSLRGSENDSKDMAAYIAAADSIREAFNCAVVVVHHCGIDGTRPRGSTALTGAVDAQLSVKRDASDAIVIEVEFMKDGACGDIIPSRLKVVDVGNDVDGEIISSCVIEPTEICEATADTEPKMTKNQQTMFSILHAAGNRGLSQDEWYEQAKAIGIGTTRPATLFDIREALRTKGMIVETMNGWTVKQPCIYGCDLRTVYGP
jgi:AAA domain-containing protein